MLNATTVIDADATFTVSLGFDQENALLCKAYGMPYVPGCISITEMLTAPKSGVEVVKLFPGSVMESNYIKAVKEPLPHINIMTTGGVRLGTYYVEVRVGSQTTKVVYDSRLLELL